MHMPSHELVDNIPIKLIFLSSFLKEGRFLGRLEMRGGSGACGREGDAPCRTREAGGRRPGSLRSPAFNGWTGTDERRRKPLR
jgi:hypothetical protein